MERVLIIGSPGAGKSTLARELALRTGLPVYSLDHLYWRPGWVKPDKQEWFDEVARLIAQPRWIIEGNYGGTLPLRLSRADTVIDLDLPAWLCLLRVLRRSVSSWGRVRQDMGEGCPERLNREYARFLIYTARFPWRGRRRLSQSLRNYSGRYVRLCSSEQVDRFIDQLPMANGR